MPQYGKLKIDQFLYNDSGTDVTLDLANVASKGANTFTGDQSLGDNKRVLFGNGPDFEIKHDGTDAYLSNQTGSLILKYYATNYFKGTPNGSVELYYDGSKKFETTSLGTKIIGDLWFDNPDTAGQDLQFDSSASKLKFDDNVKANFGSGDDFQIYHDGTNSHLINSTGYLNIQAKSGENSVFLARDGEVNLYFDGSKKFETTSWGSIVSGSLSATGNIDVNSDSGKLQFGAGYDQKIWHDGSHGYIDNDTGWLHVGSDNHIFTNKEFNETHARFLHDGAVELYYDNSKKLQTQSWGTQFYGNLHATDNIRINLGTGNDLSIYHDGSHSYVKDNGTGNLILAGTQVNILNAAANESMIRAAENGAVELYHDNNKKLETTSTGINVTGAITVNGAALSGGSSYASLLQHF